MAESLSGDSTFSEGAFKCNDVGLFLAWKVQRDSFADCLPAWNERKDRVLFFVGEHFGDKEDITELKTKGHQVRKADASHLIHLYEDLGNAFFERLNGSFCGVLLDLRAKTGIVFNDRFGLENLYYYENGTSLYFATEANVLLRLDRALGSLAEASLGEWLRYGSVFENRTLFERIFRLPPGTALHFAAAGSRRRESYFDPRVWETQPYLGCDFFMSRVKETLSTIFPRYVKAICDVAFCHSGFGSLLMLMLGEMPRGKMAFCKFSEDCGESQRVVGQFGQTHHFHRVGGDFFAEFSRYAEDAALLSGGTADVTGSLTLYQAKRARSVAPILLTGSFWYDVFVGGGNRWLETTYGMTNSDLASTYDAAGQRFQEIVEGHPLSVTLLQLIPTYRSAHLAIARSQVAVRTPYLDRDLLALLFRTPLHSNWAVKAALQTLVNDGKDLVQSPPKRQSIFAGKTPTNALEFSSLICDDFVLHPRPILPKKRIEARYLHCRSDTPNSLFRDWLRNQLADYLQDVLLDPGTLNRPYFTRREVEGMLYDHISGRSDNTTIISRLLGLELTLRAIAEAKGDACSSCSR